MARRAATTAPATPDPIEARTDEGTGLVLPIAKAISHLMTVYNALTRNWEMDVDATAAEMEDAIVHLRQAFVPREAMTDEASLAVDAWIADMTRKAANVRTQLTGDDNTAAIESIRVAATSSWQLLAIIDRELTGMPVRQVDPGRLP